MPASDFFDRTVVIQSRTTAQDSIGGINSAWTSRTTAVPCCMWPASSQMANEYARENINSLFQIVTTANIAATADDRAVIGGENYGVLGSKPYSNSFIAGVGPLYVTIIGQRR